MPEPNPSPVPTPVELRIEFLRFEADLAKTIETAKTEVKLAVEKTQTAKQ